jgi:hypothetical protein
MATDRDNTRSGYIYTPEYAHGDKLPTAIDRKPAPIFPESEELFTFGPFTTANQINDLIGRITMTLKANVTPDEWTSILQAPFVAGFALTAADPGGLIGAVQESAAMSKTLKDAAGDDEDDLANAVMSELKSSEGRSRTREAMKSLIKGRKPAEASEMAIENLKETLAVVHQKSPADYDEFGALITSVATNVAEAAKEGGFMGFGGEPVSDAEKKALSDIEAAIAGAKV